MDLSLTYTSIKQIDVYNIQLYMVSKFILLQQLTTDLML